MKCDYTTAFCRKGKVWPFKNEVFGRISLREKINEDDSTQIEKHVCANGRKRLASVNKLRLELFLKKHKQKESELISNMKFDGNQLPPCSRVLEEKIKWTDYITGVWLSSVFLSQPDQLHLDYGWIIYTTPKVSSQMVKATIASIYWYKSGWKRVWLRRY